jgi:hypothetical protein
MSVVDPTPRERRAAVYAKIVKGGDAIRRSPKDYRLIEQFYRKRLICEILRARHGMPISTQDIVGRIFFGRRGGLCGRIFAIFRFL